MLVVVCTVLVNPWRTHKISCKALLFMWFAGLRGAIAFALAIQSVDDFKNGEVILTVTTVFAVVSVVLGGSFVNSLLHCLGLFQQADGESPLRRGAPTTNRCWSWMKNGVLRLDQNFIYPHLVRTPESRSRLESEIELLSS